MVLLITIFSINTSIHVNNTVSWLNIRNNIINNGKYDRNQNIKMENCLKIWNTTWGGIGFEEGYDIALDSAGNIYTVGYTTSYGAGGYDVALVKFYPNGTLAWNQTWGGINSDKSSGIALDSSENIYVVGYTASYTVGSNDLVLIKFYPNGTKAWNTTWGGPNTDYGFGIALDSSGNIYTVGSTLNYVIGDYDFVIVKFYPNGTKAWNLTWGGVGYDEGRCIALDSAGNIYLSGYTNSYSLGGYDLALVKFYPNGTKAWNETWGGPNYDDGYNIALDSSGNIYIVGNTESYGLGSRDMAVIKFYPNGTKAWNTTWGGTNFDDGYGIALDSTGNIYTVGYSNSYSTGTYDLVLVKFYSNNIKAWNTSWGGSSTDKGYGISLDSSENIYTIGMTNSFGASNSDFALVSFVDDINPPQVNHPQDLVLFQNSVGSIGWVITDDLGAGYYRVFVNGIPTEWATWSNNSNLAYPVNTSTIGIFNYTIQFNDSLGNWWSSDTVIVTVTLTSSTIPIPSFLIVLVINGLLIIVLTLKFKRKYRFIF